METERQRQSDNVRSGDASPPLDFRAPFRVSAVLFDFDGTLTRPDLLDLGAIKRMIGCPPGTGILEYLRDLDDPDERRTKEAIMIKAEIEAADRAEPSAGAEELVGFLREQHVPMAIITRNAHAMVERALERFAGVDSGDFAAIVSRDLPMSPKPLPDGVVYVADKLQVPVEELLIIGDHAFDIEAGVAAGALTMFVLNDADRPGPEVPSDFVVADLEEARRVIRYGLPLAVGKLPLDLLRESLRLIGAADPAVLVGSGIGEDAAVMNVEGAGALVLASDPITLASESLGRYAVLANANDVATTGADPKWLLTVLLFPPGSTPSGVLTITREIATVCGDLGISLCGGHTEITDAVCRPMVVGTMAGTIEPGHFVDKRHMREGDRILLTKWVAIEGTGLIALEFPERLREVGMTDGEISECARFLDRVGIVEEARVARSFEGVTAMHDVTEGGLATALTELGAAGGRRLRVHVDRIPVYTQTRRICAALGLDPLGLIGSGSLLITCSPADAQVLAEAIAALGVEVTDIGEVLGRGEGVDALRSGKPEAWPHFDRDEVSRLGR